MGRAKEGNPEKSPSCPCTKINPTCMDTVVTSSLLYATIAGMAAIVAGIYLRSFWAISAGLALIFISDTILIVADYYEHRNIGSTH
jgi:predicted transporter